MGLWKNLFGPPSVDKLSRSGNTEGLRKLLANPDKNLVREAADAIVRLEGLDGLISGVVDVDTEAGNAASGILLQQGKQLGPALMSALKGANAMARAGAARLLGQLKETGAVEALIMTLDQGNVGFTSGTGPLPTVVWDGNVDVRVEAATALGKIGGELGAQALLKVMQHQYDCIAVNGSSAVYDHGTYSWKFRRAAAEAVGRLEMASTIEPLRKVLAGGFLSVTKFSSGWKHRMPGGGHVITCWGLQMIPEVPGEDIAVDAKALAIDVGGSSIVATEVQDMAAIALGLLGDPIAAKRLKDIIADLSRGNSDQGRGATESQPLFRYNLSLYPDFLSRLAREALISCEGDLKKRPLVDSLGRVAKVAGGKAERGSAEDATHAHNGPVPGGLVYVAQSASDSFGIAIRLGLIPENGVASAVRLAAPLEGTLAVNGEVSCVCTNVLPVAGSISSGSVGGAPPLCCPSCGTRIAVMLQVDGSTVVMGAFVEAMKEEMGGRRIAIALAGVRGEASQTSSGTGHSSPQREPKRPGIIWSDGLDTSDHRRIIEAFRKHEVDREWPDFPGLKAAIVGLSPIWQHVVWLDIGAHLRARNRVDVAIRCFAQGVRQYLVDESDDRSGAWSHLAELTDRRKPGTRSKDEMMAAVVEVEERLGTPWCSR